MAKKGQGVALDGPSRDGALRTWWVQGDALA